MKYCSQCGKELLDDAVVCPNCGCQVGYVKSNTTSEVNSVLATVAKIFMIIGCISSGWAIIPLIWTVPMTIHYWKAIDNNERIGVGFKVCTLLFVNLIAGVLMLVDTDH